MNLGLSDFFDLTPDMVWIMGRDGYLKRVNKTVINKLGYSEKELYTNLITKFLHPDDIEITLNNRNRLFAGEVLHNFTNRYITRSGDIVWLEWTSVYIAEKEVIFGIAKDITARKKIEREVEEEYVKFKGLATHFKSRIESDREYFAYELHEELAQLVSVINMDVSWLKQQLHELPQKVIARVEHASEVSKLLIKTIQRLAFSISPKMLDDFGLIVTLEWLCNEFTILHGIECRLTSSVDEGILTKEIKIDFFRICQEALTDILNLQQAGQITISIQSSGDFIELMIRDTESGFNNSTKKQTDALVSISERANSINAEVKLLNFPASGSGISIQMDRSKLRIA